MTSGELTDAEHLKFEILARGIAPTPAAAGRLRAVNEDRQLTPADYASTTGLILRLQDDVWVNAPTADNNPNFVDAEASIVRFDWDGEGYFVENACHRSRAWFWPPPLYHGERGRDGRPYNNYVYTHGDRARIAPIQGCAMVCKFCNVPYDDRYDIKPIDSMLEALDVALNDSLQPARHVLISGGTPHAKHFEFLQEAYRQVLTRFSHVPVDIMMVPVDGLLLVDELADLGVNDLSINIEVIDKELSHRYMRQKLQHGLDHYLWFIEDAAMRLGPGRVRSMLMVGLEPPEQTLRGVELILEAGGVPVLSPFRPDTATPLADLRPPSVEDMISVYTEACSLAEKAHVSLGPQCPPCTHNTMTLLGAEADYCHPLPTLV